MVIDFLIIPQLTAVLNYKSRYNPHIISVFHRSTYLRLVLNLDVLWNDAGFSVSSGAHFLIVKKKTIFSVLSSKICFFVPKEVFCCSNPLESGIQLTKNPSLQSGTFLQFVKFLWKNPLLFVHSFAITV
jgi:hypothetical protein